ncbi:MAG: FAD assembly factor SdhE [Gammaproteobacteria bacterium]
MTSEAVNRLRWRCRRGMKELDQVLVAWLDRYGDSLDADGLELFARFLETNDMELYAWVTGRARPDDAAFAGLLDDALAAHAASV